MQGPDSWMQMTLTTLTRRLLSTPPGRTPSAIMRRTLAVIPASGHGILAFFVPAQLSFPALTR